MQFLDDFLNGITMYRLMQWYLRFLFGIAVVLSFLKVIPYNPYDILISGFYLIAVCYVANQFLGFLFKVKPNYESQFITGLILGMIVGPLPLLPNVLFLTGIAIIAMASKYLIAYQKQHIFNPAAFAVVFAAIFLGRGASWWIDALPMIPFIALGGLIILRKIHRFNLIFAFLATYLLYVVIANYQISVSFTSHLQSIISAFFAFPVIFFVFVMLPEPITTPSDKNLRMYYGIFTVLVFIVLQRLFTVSYTLELSLLFANLVGRMVRFNTKYNLILKQKKEIVPTIWEFIFEPVRPIQYIAGQFLEWSLPHKHADSRGARRFFTIASSPSEKDILLTVKIPEKPSTFKSALKSLAIGESLYATSLEGDFTEPKDKKNQYVFIAGGIGITPFRSIIMHLLESKTKITITLFYADHSPEEFVFKDIFDKAEREIGLKTVYVLSDNPPQNWQGETGHIDQAMIKRHVNDEKQAIYYISGPQPMVIAYEKILSDMNINKSQVKTDYFPGYSSV